MVAQAKPTKTRGQLLEESRQRWDWQHQMAAQRAQEQAQHEVERTAFAGRVQAAQHVHDVARHRLEMQVEDGKLTSAVAAEIQVQANEEAHAAARTAMPSLASYFQDKRTIELQEAQRLEDQRLATITPKENWLASLDWSERRRVRKFEAIRQLCWPGTEGM